MNKLKAYFLKQQFRPNWFAIFINPFYYGRSAIFNQIRKNQMFITGKTLDIGCGDKHYELLFKKVTQYVGMDIEVSGHVSHHSKVDVYYDGKIFPFDNESFDSAVCFEVLEHVFNPDDFLSEIYRILKPESKFLITVPFIWDEHEQPYDYARYSSFGLKHLFEKNGFTIEKHIKYLNNFRLIHLLINTYIYKTVKQVLPGFFAIPIILFLTSIINLLGIFAILIPKNHDFYFGNMFVLTKVK